MGIGALGVICARWAAAAELMTKPNGLLRLLVPHDLSAGADHALERTLTLALGRNAELRLLHVLPRTLKGEAADLARRGAARALDERVDRAEAKLRRRGREDVAVRGMVAQGREHEEICRAAERLGVNLVVIGRHGMTRGGARDIGSTAGRVLRSAPAPILVVTRARQGPYRKPLVGVDLSPTCRRAIRTLLQLLPEEARTRVTAVHADETPFENALVLGGATAAEIRKYRRGHVTHMTRELGRFLEEFRPESATWRLVRRTGDPRTHLLSLARPDRADIVALGTHGRSGLARALLGSVAESVTRAARIDVLVAPAGGGS